MDRPTPPSSTPKFSETKVDTPRESDKSAILGALPPPDTTRWVTRRKANVVQAVLSGAISIEDVCTRYGLSVEEFDSWHRLIERHGVHGLRSTKLHIYRDASRRQR
jgi:transposase-like protein